MRYRSRLLPLLATLLASTLVSLAATAPAGAVVQTVVGRPVGLQPRDTTRVLAGDLEEQLPGEGVFEKTNPIAETFGNPNGNPVLHANDTYAVYWDPTNQYRGYWQRLINTFLHGVGADSGSLRNIFAVDSQYTDTTNQPALYRSTFRGAYTDTDKYPSSGCVDPHPLEPGDASACLTDQQIREELNSFIIQHSLQTGMGTIFYVLTPPGVTICLDGGGAAGHCSDYAGSPGGISYEKSFCSYHSDIDPDAAPQGDGKTVLYAAIPWTAGGLGDGHLGPKDRTMPAYDCQDGGFDPTSQPIEKREKAKEESKKEKEEFEAKNAEEKLKAEEATALEGPHQQEPNQGTCPSQDGYCDAGLADLIVNQIAVEQQNVTTDPLLDSWQDANGDEVTDECRNFFANGSNGAHDLGGSVAANDETGAGALSNELVGGGNYYLNDTFSWAGLFYGGVPCVGAVNLVPSFTAPNPVNAGDVVGFDGMESYVELDRGIKYAENGEVQPNYPTFTWNFGDGSPIVSGHAPGAPSANSPSASPCEAPWQAPCAASTFHTYQYGGAYQVTLTVKDVGGNTASVTKSIVVAGPPRPEGSQTSPVGSSGALGSSQTSAGAPGVAGAPGSSAPGSATKPAVPGPVATQAVSPASLARTLRRGLLVRYSVSQQAAGHFEVLLAASIAKRIGLHLPLATGLPAGTPPQVVLAKALLVTTRPGRGAIRIQFGKLTAKRLRRLHNVPLLLRLQVRNGGGGTTTVLSQLTLH